MIQRIISSSERPSVSEGRRKAQLARDKTCPSMFFACPTGWLSHGFQIAFRNLAGSGGAVYFPFSLAGQVAEWLKAHAWKVCNGESRSRVRIPLCPPLLHDLFEKLRGLPLATSALTTG